MLDSGSQSVLDPPKNSLVNYGNSSLKKSSLALSFAFKERKDQRKWFLQEKEKQSKTKETALLVRSLSGMTLKHLKALLVEIYYQSKFPSVKEAIKKETNETMLQ